MIFTAALLGTETSPQGPAPKTAAEMEPDVAGEMLVKRPKREKGEEESREVILGEQHLGGKRKQPWTMPENLSKCGCL